jgi:hypothetical protein
MTEPQKTPDDHDHDKAEVETIRQLTGAPDIHKPLVTQDAFADVNISSERPIWKLPMPKLGFIAVALIPIFGFAGFFLVGNRGKQQQAAVPDNSSATKAEPEEDVTATDLQQAQQEVATLKSKMALDDQAYVKQSSQSAKTPAASTPEPKEEGTTATPLSKPETVAVRTSPPTVSYSPPPLIQSSSSAVRRVEPMTQAGSVAELEPVDPFEHWQQLAQLGSYGSISASSADEPLETELVAEGLEPFDKGAVPTAYFSPTSAILHGRGYAIAPTYQPAIFQEEAQSEQLSDNSDQDGPIKPAILEKAEQVDPESSDKTDEPPVLTEAEARILDEQFLEESSQVRSLIAGGHSSGELVTPVVLDSEGVEDRFLVVLAEPLMDNTASVAIPEGSVLVVQVDRTSEDGLVQLSATQAIWEEQGLQRELVLPSRTILIRGQGGDPLIAEGYGDSGGDIAAMDIGAIRRIGELYTRSDSRVQTGDGATVITESNPAPNILAGALEGGSEAILDSISERNQRAIEKLEQRPQIPYIPANTQVQAFINQSMQMPAGF